MCVPRLSFLKNMCWHHLLTLLSLITINHLSGCRYFLKWLIWLIIFRMTVRKDLFIRMDFNQSTKSVIQVVLWPPPPPLRLPLLWHHHASHWSVTILQREPIRSVRAGYTSLLFKHSVPHAVFRSAADPFCRVMLALLHFNTCQMLAINNPSCSRKSHLSVRWKLFHCHEVQID